jgi:citryl-CoA lyase
MEFKTKISKIESGDVTIRGEKLSSLVKTGNFTDSIFLLLSGRKPNENESLLFEKVLTAVIDHGMGTTSSLSSRFVASGGNSLNVGVGAGVLSIGNYHGGAIENAMKFFYELKDTSDEDVKEKVKDMLTKKETIYGFGHKIYKQGDPRVAVILEEMKTSTFLRFKDVIESTIKETKGKQIPINIDGLIAIILCDFGFDPLLGKGIFIIGRTPGLVAQTYEELKEEKPVRRLDEEDITYIK